jgi:pimeloyl-ACP methyl ester carboxylesterase
MNLHFRTLGEGQPLIILHGLMGSCDNWLTVSKPLSEKYQLFIVDQRNHGRSPWSEEFNYDVMVQDLSDFIHQHNIIDPIILGHSMGGKIAMKFAAENPTLLKKLIVVDISPRYYPPHHQDVLAGLNAIDLDILQNRVEADHILSQHISSFDVRQFLLKNLYRNEENKFAWRINLEVINAAIDNIGEALPSNLTFNKPTLFIGGSLSDYINDNDKIEIKNTFTNSEVIMIENANHWVQATQQLAFLEAVNNFI